MSTAAQHPAPQEMRPPQFGLRSLFIWMTGLGALFAFYSTIGVLWSVVISFFLLLVLTHVGGNALGTRLRESQTLNDALPDVDEADPYRMPDTKIVPAQRLQEKTGLRRPWLVGAAVGAAIFGSTGGIVIATIVGKRLSVPGLALGIASMAILGAFAGFMLSSLIGVARTALKEALEADDTTP